MNDTFLGMVKKGEFKPFGSKIGLRLTSIQMQEARPPESGELNLDKYEGSAIMVSGKNSGGWVYSTQIVDHAGPILTSVAQRVLGKYKKEGQ